MLRDKKGYGYHTLKSIGIEIRQPTPVINVDNLYCRVSDRALIGLIGEDEIYLNHELLHEMLDYSEQKDK